MLSYSWFALIIEPRELLALAQAYLGVIRLFIRQADWSEFCGQRREKI
ncbi:hypothetical protein [Cohnella abietis]|nr:hypothetical protein [Cohnella abietis]